MKIYSYSPAGYEGYLVDIETDIRRGLPGIDIVGLPDGAVREARDRIRIAIKRSGFDFPNGRIVINLSPAGVRKGGAFHDLALALSLLVADGQVNFNTEKFLVSGELQLSGKVLPVNNIVSAAACAIDNGIDNFIVPEENYSEAASLGRGRIIPIKSLEQAVEILDYGMLDEYDNPVQDVRTGESFTQGDFSMLRGQKRLRRALEIAAAGSHHVLMFGPPGAGKTLAARCFPSILPDLNEDETIEITRIFSAGNPASGIISRPQFRAPHHSASCEGILGGGQKISPGEISYAHNGVLFLDEAPEFQKRLLQALREPLEEGIVRIVRAGRNYWFPARFQLIMASNICPCGSLGKNRGICKCSEKEIQRYWDRIGGALLDRIDMRLPVEPVDSDVLLNGEAEESSSIRKRVDQALGIQKERYSGMYFSRNSHLPVDMINKFCRLDEEGAAVIKQGLEKLGLSSRAGHSVLKVARTIADLSGEDSLKKEHVLEALEYRRYGDGDYYWYS